MSDILKLINNWFDVLNSAKKFESHSAHAYRIELEKQNEIVEQTNNFILKLRISKNSHLLPEGNTNNSYWEYK